MVVAAVMVVVNVVNPVIVEHDTVVVAIPAALAVLHLLNDIRMAERHVRLSRSWSNGV